MSFPPAFAGARLLADDETPWHTAPPPEGKPPTLGSVWESLAVTSIG